MDDLKTRLYNARIGACDCRFISMNRLDEHHPMCQYRLVMEACSELGDEQTRVRNLVSSLKTLRDTKSTIPRWVRELARTVLEFAGESGP